MNALIRVALAWATGGFSAQTHTLIGFMGLGVIGVGGIVTLQIIRPDGWDSRTTETILAVLTLLAAQLVNALKSAENGKKLDVQNLAILPTPANPTPPLVDAIAEKTVEKTIEATAKK